MSLCLLPSGTRRGFCCTVEPEHNTVAACDASLSRALERIPALLPACLEKTGN